MVYRIILNLEIWFFAGDVLHGKVFVRLQLSCSSHIEFAFYASNIGRVDLCAHCASPETNKDQEQLKKIKSRITCLWRVYPKKEIYPQKKSQKVKCWHSYLYFQKYLMKRLWHPEPQQFFCCFIDSLFEVLSDICFISINLILI